MQALYRYSRLAFFLPARRVLSSALSTDTAASLVSHIYVVLYHQLPVATKEADLANPIGCQADENGPLALHQTLPLYVVLPIPTARRSFSARA